MPPYKDGTYIVGKYVENLADLESVAAEYERDTEEPSLAGFLERVSLVADADEIPDDDDGVVTMMTLHTAKGLEFPVVFLTGMEDGIFPHIRSLGSESELEEERRLAYVGITRAREQFTLIEAEAGLLEGAIHRPSVRASGLVQWWTLV